MFRQLTIKVCGAELQMSCSISFCICQTNWNNYSCVSAWAAPRFQGWVQIFDPHFLVTGDKNYRLYVGLPVKQTPFRLNISSHFNNRRLT